MRAENLEREVEARESFARELRRAMVEANMVAEDIEIRTGIRKKTITDYMRGASTPTVPKLAKICEGIGITPNDLMGW